MTLEINSVLIERFEDSLPIQENGELDLAAFMQAIRGHIYAGLPPRFNCDIDEVEELVKELQLYIICRCIATIEVADTEDKLKQSLIYRLSMEI